jgi:hypothetical protein
MNLSLIKSNLSPEVIDIADLYIINETGIVICATYEDDIGLDFKQWPAVYEDITRIRKGNDFEADRAVYGFNSSKNSRKFAYYQRPITGMSLNSRISLLGLQTKERIFRMQIDACLRT